MNRYIMKFYAFLERYNLDEAKRHYQVITRRRRPLPRPPNGPQGRLGGR